MFFDQPSKVSQKKFIVYLTEIFVLVHFCLLFTFLSCQFFLSMGHCPLWSELLLKILKNVFFLNFRVDTLVIMGDDNLEEHFMEKQIDETSKNDEN